MPEGEKHWGWGPVVIGGDNLPSLVWIGLTDLHWPPRFRHHCLGGVVCRVFTKFFDRYDDQDAVHYSLIHSPTRSIMIYYCEELPEPTLKLIWSGAHTQQKTRTLCICKMLYYRQVLIKPGGKIPVLFTVVVSVEIGGHSITMLINFLSNFRYILPHLTHVIFPEKNTTETTFNLFHFNWIIKKCTVDIRLSCFDAERLGSMFLWSSKTSIEF